MESAGSPVLGRFLSSELVADIGHRSDVSLRMNLPRNRRAGESGNAVPSPETVITPAGDHLEVSRLLADPLGRPVVQLAFQPSREITRQASSSLRFALFSLLLAGSLVVLAIMAVINRLVVLPVGKIEAFVESFADTDDLTTRLQ
ncbi:hypothetical protein [Synechococcus sp. CCY 9618]|uniref:hypothetical protein n=1 Tax=Synechococcus sp. CCY 9618 TaxID=2815602 RepID=UPI001C2404DE|nr:hypothetical protein [Synechococcus sp. CCY 9618]